MANTSDLRYVRTEAAIRDAFMALVAAVPVSSVRVSDVCRQAGVSRNAFYLHHASVAELYTSLVCELVDDVRKESVLSSKRRVATGNDDEFCEAIIASLARHETLLRALLPADDGTLAKQLACGIEEAYVEGALVFGEHGGSLTHRLSCSYAAWGAVGFVERWVASTERPLIEGTEQFKLLQTSVVDLAAWYLLGGAEKDSGKAAEKGR